ncbi:MAG TPA: hypothetical protein VHN98_09025 [Acidimicrobiales bacterium]|nr:hypothetical protein [Acidimicrobiales bacterium]
MTTITAPTTSATTATRLDAGLGIWRLVATFVAGALLAGAAATGVTAAVVHDSSPAKVTTPRIVYVTPSGPADECPARAASPC